jgi:hypothetical protein
MSNQKSLEEHCITCGHLLPEHYSTCNLPDANKIQIGGSHYQTGGLQHWDVVLMFGLGYFEGQITKYLFRWRKKNGVEDLKKARHFLDKLIESETKEPSSPTLLSGYNM